MMDILQAGRDLRQRWDEFCQTLVEEAKAHSRWSALPRRLRRLFILVASALVVLYVAAVLSMTIWCHIAVFGATVNC